LAQQLWSLSFSMTILIIALSTLLCLLCHGGADLLDLKGVGISGAISNSQSTRVDDSELQASDGLKNSASRALRGGTVGRATHRDIVQCAADRWHQLPPKPFIPESANITVIAFIMRARSGFMHPVLSILEMIGLINATMPFTNLTVESVSNASILPPAWSQPTEEDEQKRFMSASICFAIFVGATSLLCELMRLVLMRFVKWWQRGPHHVYTGWANENNFHCMRDVFFLLYLMLYHTWLYTLMNFALDHGYYFSNGQDFELIGAWLLFVLIADILSYAWVFTMYAFHLQEGQSLDHPSSSVVFGVLPVLGTKTDTMRDYSFTGLCFAESFCAQEPWKRELAKAMGYLALASIILPIPILWLQPDRRHELRAEYLPALEMRTRFYQHTEAAEVPLWDQGVAMLARKTVGKLVPQVTTAKLLNLISEDILQAMLATVFIVVFFAGSLVAVGQVVLCAVKVAFIFFSRYAIIPPLVNRYGIDDDPLIMLTRTLGVRYRYAGDNSPAHIAAKWNCLQAAYALRSIEHDATGLSWSENLDSSLPLVGDCRCTSIFATENAEGQLPWQLACKAGYFELASVLQGALLELDGGVEDVQRKQKRAMRNLHYTETGIWALPTWPSHLSIKPARSELLGDGYLQQLAKHVGSWAAARPGFMLSLHLDLRGSKNFTDSGLEKLGAALPSSLTALHLDFNNLTDSGLEKLVAALPSSLTALHLDFRCNGTCADSSLEKLGAALPSSLTALDLDFRHNANFTDAGLEKLTAALPSSLTSLHLFFSGNFTDSALEKLTAALPSSLTALHLVFPCNKNFTDSVLEKLAAALPSSLTGLGLYFQSNENFTDAGLEKLAASLPSSLTALHLDFEDNENFTDSALER